MNLQESEVKILALENERMHLCETDGLVQEAIDKQIETIRRKAYAELDAWDIVYLARHPKRPKAEDYLKALFPDFMEFHGDRCFQDDQACAGGIARFHGRTVTILAQRKGKTLDENRKYNFGMLHPEGYRKAVRLAKQAEKFHRPIITLIDTSGAYPGKGAEERGQAEAIAKCLEVFARLSVPVVAIVLSEGGSGGALAFSVADHIMMLENAIYSVLSPEGFASILWKDGSRAAEAANLMELTAADLYHKQVIDTIIKEPEGGAHICFEYVVDQIDHKLSSVLDELLKKKSKVLLQERYAKFRRMGNAYEFL